MKILIDRGHGIPVTGNCSPVFDADMQKRYGMERLYEWKYCDMVAKELKKRLDEHGYDAVLITPEEYDIGLGERVNRVNRYCHKYGATNCVSVCIHLNAASATSKWNKATGYTGWIAMNASTRSKRLASIFEAKATELDMLGNRCGHTFQHNWAMVHHTKCPAILTESAFQDNLEEVQMLLSDEGFDKVVRLHLESIIAYIDAIK